MISATPETLHYPMARECLLAGKHVFLEKPIAIELHEADELIAIAKQEPAQVHHRLFAALQSQVRLRQESRSRDGTIGKPVSALVSRHITRSLGKKITGRSKLSPAAMEPTHDLDFVLWCLEPAKPVRVYSQVNYGAMKESTGARHPRHAVDHRHHGQRACRSWSAAAGACRPAIRTSPRPGSR